MMVPPIPRSKGNAGPASRSVERRRSNTELCGQLIRTMANAINVRFTTSKSYGQTMSPERGSAAPSCRARGKVAPHNVIGAVIGKNPVIEDDASHDIADDPAIRYA